MQWMKLECVIILLLCYIVSCQEETAILTPELYVITAEDF